MWHWFIALFYVHIFFSNIWLIVGTAQGTLDLRWLLPVIQKFGLYMRKIVKKKSQKSWCKTIYLADSIIHGLCAVSWLIIYLGSKNSLSIQPPKQVQQVVSTDKTGKNVHEYVHKPPRIFYMITSYHEFLPSVMVNKVQTLMHEKRDNVEKGNSF